MRRQSPHNKADVQLAAVRCCGVQSASLVFVRTSMRVFFFAQYIIFWCEASACLSVTAGLHRGHRVRRNNTIRDTSNQSQQNKSMVCSL